MAAEQAKVFDESCADMGYVVPTGFSRVTFNYTGASSAGSLPCWGIGIDRSPDVDLLNDLGNWWIDNLKGRTNGGVTLESIEARNDFDAIELPMGEAGGRSGNYQAPQVAALVKLTSPAIGRKNRGRIFWPFVLLDTEIDGSGVIDSGAVTALQDAVDELVAVLDVSDVRLFILHSVEGAPSPVTSQVVQQQAATQRRRNRR